MYHIAVALLTNGKTTEEVVFFFYKNLMWWTQGIPEWRHQLGRVFITWNLIGHCH